MQPTYCPGQLVVFAGQLYRVSITITIMAPPYPTWPPGLYLALRQEAWPLTSFLIVPVQFVDRTGEMVA